MKEWFYEFLTIISLSKKVQWFIIVGIVGAIIIYMYGEHLLNNFQLSGPLEPMTEVVKKALKGKYDKAALGCLGTSMLLAIKQYRKDKKRFNNLW